MRLFDTSTWALAATIAVPAVNWAVTSTDVSPDEALLLAATMSPVRRARSAGVTRCGDVLR